MGAMARPLEKDETFEFTLSGRFVCKECYPKWKPMAILAGILPGPSDLMRPPIFIGKSRKINLQWMLGAEQILYTDPSKTFLLKGITA